MITCAPCAGSGPHDIEQPGDAGISSRPTRRSSRSSHPTSEFAERRRAIARGGIYVLIGHDHFGAARGRLLGTVPQALGQMALSPFVAHLPRPALSQPRKPEAMAVLREALASRSGTVSRLVAPSDRRAEHRHSFHKVRGINQDLRHV